MNFRQFFSVKYVIYGFLCVYMFYHTWHGHYGLKHLKNLKQDLIDKQMTYEKMQHDLERMKRDVTRWQNPKDHPAMVNHRIRQDLGYVHPDETIYLRKDAP